MSQALGQVGKDPHWRVGAWVPLGCPGPYTGGDWGKRTRLVKWKLEVYLLLSWIPVLHMVLVAGFGEVSKASKGGAGVAEGVLKDSGQ